MGAKRSGPFLHEADAARAADLAADLRCAFGRNFRRARLAAGLSQREVEAETGVKQGVLEEIEQGRTDPALKTMVALARVVDRDLLTLLPPPE